MAATRRSSNVRLNVAACLSASHRDRNTAAESIFLVTVVTLGKIASSR
jgi:hypothetical protein